MADMKFDITDFKNYKDVSGQYSDEFIKSSLCVKISENESSVRVCAVDDVPSLVSLYFPKTIDVVKVSDSDFAEFIGSIVDNVTNVVSNDMKNESILFNLEQINSDAPVVNIINAICLEALRKNVSDIHIQPVADYIKVRFRLDGVLKTVKILSKGVFQNLVSRIKVMSQLNIMENRLPQDGRMSVLLDGKRIDFRVSIVPVSYGQSIVMRLFNYTERMLTLNELGFSNDDYEILKNSVRLPFGMILVTGPTGSGKTTTLHALLKEMDMEGKKIMTIEDPVERVLEGIDQIQVNEEIGLTFDVVLRRILRQDPDVIMIGEIRDRQTAQLAVRAALTGHLILATLHTNDSVSAITRLVNLGVEPFLISSVLKYCSAQRLVRTVCNCCNGAGCENCNNIGYKGRTVISEIFSIDESLVNSICKADEADIRTKLVKRGFKGMLDDAKYKVELGVTTMDEIQREVLV